MLVTRIIWLPALVLIMVTQVDNNNNLGLHSLTYLTVSIQDSINISRLAALESASAIPAPAKNGQG